MNYYTDSVNKLIEKLSKLPGIGGKSAQRLAFYIINSPVENVMALSEAMLDVKKKIKYCSVCSNFSDTDVCNLCSSSNRDKKIIMVVESPQDMAAYERTNEFKGLYHILHGLISPMNNVGPNDLKIKQLLDRIQNGQTQEVILATNSTVEGEATAMYISKLIKPLGVKTTRIAYGIPIGADLQYADEVTLSKALEGRREF
jgi:recombination protein RecR